MDNNGHPDLRTLVKSVQGLRCWYVSCGGAAGSSFQLALGNKVLRRVPLKNPAHSEEYRRFEGEAGLLVWCAWRLDGPDEPVTSWDAPDEAVQQGLARLMGATVEDVSLTAPAWDLTARFSNGLWLRVFCDHVPGEPSFDGNWELWRQDIVVAVGPGARVIVEARGEPAAPAEG